MSAYVSEFFLVQGPDNSIHFHEKPSTPQASSVLKLANGVIDEPPFEAVSEEPKKDAEEQRAKVQAEMQLQLSASNIARGMHALGSDSSSNNM